ncbi:IS3 family transposase [Listeria monocytogenes]|uniref:IS3 family transposase n=1 Tax=Listeria monocytogenes TaxID=1639 RepID=UPI00098E6A9D|nr:IS3 family transposase [Listeria monocytogenes]EAD8868680.1 hypothetical protein [Listeria monocytogenes]EIP0641635.1 IS3 family transposase [Listeria monocytogenes]EIP0651854.1 IS3 family transposase [Listeria monocytogenes]EIP0659201.1 IS3 family transposase [Listeria monocytogenes]EIP0662048.1 IS3 family transposase [Listeria monocytogenes]
MTVSLVTETIELASQAVRQALDRRRLVVPFSKKSYPWDNVVNEASFKYMKKEKLNRRIFQTLEEVELACFEYSEGFYNSKRSHDFNDMLTPYKKENHFFHTSSLF